MPLAYVDVRPLISPGGLPVFLLLFVSVWLGCRISGGWGRASLVGTVAWASLFALFFTEVGPFVGQRRAVQHRMAWEVRPSSEGAEPVVELTFVEDLSHWTAFVSEELAEHLERRGEAGVEVRFEVTSDYGQVRGYHATSSRGSRAGRTAAPPVGPEASGRAGPPGSDLGRERLSGASPLINGCWDRW